MFPLMANTQSYADLVKIGFGQTLKNNFRNEDASTNIQLIDLDLTLPIVLNPKHIFIAGAAYSQYNLQLFPVNGSGLNKSNSLHSSTLKIGLLSIFNDKWSGTVMLLPKIASDYTDISRNDFYMGGTAFFKWHISERLTYHFGFYISEEAYGYLTNPIVGCYYISANKKFEMDLWLPNSAKINYRLGNLTYGMHYIGLGRSYFVEAIDRKKYVALNSVEGTAYVQFNMRQNSVLLRAKLGYARNDFRVYDQEDKVVIGFLGKYLGEERTHLNPTVEGGVLFRMEAIYRFHEGKDQ